MLRLAFGAILACVVACGRREPACGGTGRYALASSDPVVVIDTCTGEITATRAGGWAKFNPITDPGFRHVTRGFDGGVPTDPAK